MGLLDVTVDPPALAHNADSLIGAMSGVFQAGAFLGVIIGSFIMDRYRTENGNRFLCYNEYHWWRRPGRCSKRHNVHRFQVDRRCWILGLPCLDTCLLRRAGATEIAWLLRWHERHGNHSRVLPGIIYGACLLLRQQPSVQWRGPLGLALIFPAIQLIVVYFAPESPRYLLMRGRVEEAREVVMSIHAVKGDEDQEYARGEFYQMQKQAEFDQKA